MVEITQDADEVEKKTASPPSGVRRGNVVGETFCPICGGDATDPSLKRFGEYFCSDARVAEYAREIRSKQATETAAIATVAGADTTTPPATGTPDVAQTPHKKGGIGGFLKMAACCGGMLLLLPAPGLVSAGGLAAVAGSGGWLRSFGRCCPGLSHRHVPHDAHDDETGEARRRRAQCDCRPEAASSERATTVSRYLVFALARKNQN